MVKEKGRQWDGKSRPSDDTYRKRWNEIFGEKEKTLHEELMEGFEKEQEELKDEEENTREHAPHSSQQEARDE